MKMIDGTWLAYIKEIDTSAKEMVDRLIEDLVAKRGITEAFEVLQNEKINYIHHVNRINFHKFF